MGNVFHPQSNLWRTSTRQLSSQNLSNGGSFSESSCTNVGNFKLYGSSFVMNGSSCLHCLGLHCTALLSCDFILFVVVPGHTPKDFINFILVVTVKQIMTICFLLIQSKPSSISKNQKVLSKPFTSLFNKAKTVQKVCPPFL